MKRQHSRKSSTIQGRSRFSDLIVGLVIASIIGPAQLAAQGMVSGAPVVLRSQAGSIVEEAWSNLADSLHRAGDIRVFVEGGSVKQIVENACLEFLGQHGFRPQLVQSPERGGDVIQVTVLEQSVQYRLLANGQSHREVRTVMEVRRTTARDEIVKYAGPFQRHAVDTVAVRDDGGLAELRNAEERSFVDRIVGPVLLIGGAFLVVYLFFTVRN